MYRTQAREVWNFFYSQQLEDGLRITVAVLLPALILSYVHQFELGLTISLGALCVSMADAPGPIIHRANGMMYCLFFVFLVAIVTGFARLNLVTLGAEIVLFSFFFSMFNVYGTRAATVGNAAMLVMVLTMDKPVAPEAVVPHSFLIFCGGLWYMGISLLSYKARPYRPAQRALGDSIRELALFLRIKAGFYNCATNMDENYRKLVTAQIAVNEKQNAARDLLFKTREILKESTPMGRKLVLAFIDTVDLFDDITATYYDYRSLRKRYAATPVLNHISDMIGLMAAELDNIGMAIQTNRPFEKGFDYKEAQAELKGKIDAFMKEAPEESHLVLRKILVNMRRMFQRFDDILRYFDPSFTERTKTGAATHKRFVDHQSLDPKIFANNLTLSSSVFRHSVRVGIAAGLGFVLAKFIAYSHHSYWIIMTIVFMMKPAFSLTKQRNFERIIGTVAGALIGVGILAFIPGRRLLFALMVLLMIGTYSFQRVKYLVSVICMTPFIFILFKFLGLGFLTLAQERVLDTAIGCGIALLAGYLLFPNWEAGQLKQYFQNMLVANRNYLYLLADGLQGKTINLIEYRLARKQVYVSSANLSAAFQRMLSEPKNKQRHIKEIHHFVVLNHILFSNTATLTGTLVGAQPPESPAEVVRPVKRTLQVLCESIQKFDQDCTTPASESLHLDGHGQAPLSADEEQLKEQLEFMHRVSTDIAKTTTTILAG
ncbi:FUSC family membrane protein [Paraflavisolibacter sp. H34]|uniref:FUSC family protein n=1 Tax=Huijunlia imazamoxiresistens TaxID=3127457 RepID=UPI00301943B2